MSRLLLKGGRVIDPASGLDATLDVVIADGRGGEAGPSGSPARGAEVLDAEGARASARVSSTSTSTCASRGARTRRPSPPAPAAAVAGGFTAVCAMPNTDPVNDNAGIDALDRRAGAAPRARSRVYPIGAITRGQQGEELAEFGDLKAGRLRRLSPTTASRWRAPA